MEEDSNDPFSSLIISSNNSSNTNQDDNVLNEHVTAHKKLKSVRKKIDVMVDCSSIKSSRYKLKVKYGGQFRPINNGKRERYCYGKQRTLYFEEVTSSFVELLDDVSRLYPEDDSPKLCFLDNCAVTQSFIQLEDEEGYRLMLKMHEEKKEVVIYATVDKLVERDRIGEDVGLDSNNLCIGEQENYEEWSDYCHSEESYHSRHSDSEDETDNANDSAYEGELYLYDKNDPKMEIGAKYPHVVAFRRALNHYAVINDFEYELSKSEPARVTANCANPQCSWRIHATVAEDEGLNGYSVHKSLDFSAEITKNELRWEVNLEERRCSCRAWQVKGVPCVHAAALIASIRNVRWEDYVDSYFTVARLKTTYSYGIAPMPSKDKWMKHELGYKMLPPILKRPVGRPRKSRIKPLDEPTKKSHKCTRCGLYGHYRSTCKNAVPSQDNENSSSGSNRKRDANIGTAQPKKRACPPTIFKILEEENI